jgi:hypothetical protein
MSRLLKFLLFFLLIPISINGQTPNQNVRGRIADSETNIGLQGSVVTIFVVNKPLQLITDSKGEFLFSDIPVGRHKIKVSHAGYNEETIQDLLVTSGKEVVLELLLTPSFNMLEAAVISNKRSKEVPLNKSALVSARSFSVEETSRYAGGLNDPARMATAFAGVSGGDMQDNALTIRGNSPSSLTWRIEGVNVHAPNHFSGGKVAGGGFVTILSSQLVGESDFFTGAFPAEYGNALGGVFDIRMRSGNNRKWEHTVNLSTVGVDISSEGPFSKNCDASYLFNYRYSTMGLLTKAKILNEEQIPVFQDLSFKVSLPARRGGNFTIWGIWGRGDLKEPFERDSLLWKTQSDRIGFDWINSVGSFGVNHRIYRNKTSLFTSVSMTESSDKFDFERLDDFIVERPYLNIRESDRRFTLSHRVVSKVAPGLEIKTGVNLTSLFYNSDISSNSIINDHSTYSNVLDVKEKTFLGELHGELLYRLGNKLIINAGINSNYFELNRSLLLEPRAGLKWNLSENHSLSFGFGKHSRIEPLKLYFVEQNRNLSLTKSYQYTLSYDWFISENVRAKAELYLQNIYDAPGIPDSSYSVINYKQEYAFRDELINNSKGKNMGIEFTLERFFNNNFYYLLTTSLFRSRYQGGDGVWRDTRFDKGLIINLLAGKDFPMIRSKNVLSVNVRASYSGGERHAPLNIEQTVQKREAVFDNSRPFESRYPADIYADISVSYRVNHGKTSSLFYAQIKNVLGSKTRRGQIYNLQTNRIEEDAFTVVVPLVGYKIEF